MLFTRLKIFLAFIFFIGCKDNNEMRVLKIQNAFSGSATTDLNSLPGQVAIWDFSNAANIQTSGGNLDGATDLSGNGNNVILSSNKPAYHSSGGQNNLGYIDMGASGEFIKSSLTGLTTSPCTFYIVIKTPSFAADNSIVVGYGGTLKGLLERSTVNGFTQQISPYAVFCQYTEPKGLATYAEVNTISYGVACAAAHRNTTMVIKLSILRKALDTNENDQFVIEINSEPYLDVTSTGENLPTATTESIARFSTKYPNSQVSEIRCLNIIPTNVNDQLMKQGLMTKYAITQPAKVLASFGDSITAGFQSGTPGTAYMKQIMDNNKAVVYNFGVSATTVTGGGVGYRLDDLYPYFNKSYFSGSNILFAYGTNDSHLQIGTVAAWKAHYKAIIQTFLDAGFTASKLIIATPPYSTNAYVGAQLINYVTAIREIATELGITLCDFYQACITAGYDCSNVPGGDGVHPDATGENILYNALFPVIV